MTLPKASKGKGQDLKVSMNTVHGCQETAFDRSDQDARKRNAIGIASNTLDSCLQYIAERPRHNRVSRVIKRAFGARVWGAAGGLKQALLAGTCQHLTDQVA